MYIIVYRKATNHATSQGTIVYKTGDGSTWDTVPTEIATDVTYDCRDPNIIKLANGDLVVNYFLYDHIGSVQLEDAIRVIRSTDSGSTWESIISLDTDFTGVAATAGSCVQLNDDSLKMPIYGKNSGDTYRSAKVLTSSNNGATWGTEVLIADGETNVKDYSEPNFVLLENGDILCLIRTSTVIVYSVSTDDGATWSAISNAFAGTGAPHAVLLSNGKLVCIYRSTENGVVGMRTSNDYESWSDEVVVDTSSYNQMLYASPIESNGVLHIAYGLEVGGSDANIVYKSYEFSELP